MPQAPNYFDLNGGLMNPADGSDKRSASRHPVDFCGLEQAASQATHLAVCTVPPPAGSLEVGRTSALAFLSFTRL